MSPGIYGDDDDGEPAREDVRRVVAPNDGTTHVNATEVADQMRRSPMTARTLRPELDPEFRAGSWVKIGSRDLPADPRSARPGSFGQVPVSATVQGEGHTERVQIPYKPTDLANTGSESRALFPDYVVEQAVASPQVPPFVGPWLQAKADSGGAPKKVLQTLSRRVLRDCSAGPVPGYVGGFLYAMANLGLPPPQELLDVLARNASGTAMLAYCHELRRATP